MHDHGPVTGPGEITEVPQGRNLFLSDHGIRAGWRLLLYLAILLTPVALFALAARIGQGATGHSHNAGPFVISPLTSTFAEAAQFGFVLFATWIMSRIEDRSMSSYGLEHPGRDLPLALAGACWGVTFMCLLIAILWGTHHLVFTAVLLRPLSALGYGVAWGVNFILVGLFEECLFRGYLQFILTLCLAGLIRWIAPASSRANTTGFWLAAVLISFGFGFAHGSNPGESPVGLLCAALAGLVFAFSLWRTGTLWWAIGLHAAWDWAQSFLFGVADSGAVSADHLLASHPSGRILLSGGATGPEGSLFVLPVMLLIALVIAATLRRRTRPGEPYSLPALHTFTPPAQVDSTRA